MSLMLSWLGAKIQIIVLRNHQIMVNMRSCDIRKWHSNLRMIRFVSHILVLSCVICVHLDVFRLFFVSFKRFKLIKFYVKILIQTFKSRDAINLRFFQ